MFVPAAHSPGLLIWRLCVYWVGYCWPLPPHAVSRVEPERSCSVPSPGSHCFARTPSAHPWNASHPLEGRYRMSTFLQSILSEGPLQKHVWDSWLTLYSDSQVHAYVYRQLHIIQKKRKCALVKKEGRGRKTYSFTKFCSFNFTDFCVVSITSCLEKHNSWNGRRAERKVKTGTHLQADCWHLGF